jgi:hypothetical protein
MNYTEEHIEQMPPDALRWNNKRPMIMKEFEENESRRRSIRVRVLRGMRSRT